MTRVDFWFAEAEPEGAGGHFVLPGDHRALRQRCWERCSPPPCSPPAPAPRHGLVGDTARKGSPSSAPRRDEPRGRGSSALSPTARNRPAPARSARPPAEQLPKGGRQRTRRIPAPAAAITTGWRRLLKPHGVSSPHSGTSRPPSAGLRLRPAVPR